MEIARPHGFEATEAEAHPLQHGMDPNLVTDRAQLVSEFATHFTAPAEADDKLGVVPTVTEEPAPTTEAPVAEAASEAAPEPAAEAPGLAREMEQAFASVPAEAAAAPPAEPAAPATLEQSLEHAIVAAEPAAEPAPVAAEPKTGDLEFAAALAQAISSNPEAPPEPMYPAEPAAPAAVSTAGPTHFDPEAVTRAVHRVMDRMKAEIIEEILRESSK